MDKQYIAERCIEALDENEEYKNMESNDDTDPETLRMLAEELCYRKGFLDAMALIYIK
jgi:hypothetical protein